MAKRSKGLIEKANKTDIKENSLRDIFFTQGIDTSTFQILKSENDNACLYKSLANGLILDSMSEENNEVLAEKIQEDCYQWIINNSDYQLNTGETIKELVSREHFDDNDSENMDSNFEKYKTWYKYYAAMDISKIYSMEPELKKHNEILRWGGIPELIAFNKLYKYNIKVYMPKTYNKSTNKLNNGRIITKNDELIPCKNVKYILYYENNGSFKKEINLLFRNTRVEHYDLLQIK